MQTNRKLSVSRGGISLLEVLAAIFVVSIGLLGVLAVIPFGAFQVSKAQHAEYASNMLANAAVGIEVRKMIQPTEWEECGIVSLGSGGTFVFGTIPPSAPDDPEDLPYQALNCAKFIWIEPHKTSGEFTHIFCFGEEFAQWSELMRGQDDLLYSTYADKRPDFEKQGGILSSGRYTWFFTFLPTTDVVPRNEVPLSAVHGTVTVDVLACFNRVPGDDRQVPIPSDNFFPSLGGGTFVLPNAEHLELLTQTKYVFVTWGPPAQVVGGAWCRIVFLDKSDPSEPRIVVTGALPSGFRNNRYAQVYIPSGVLYHKRVEGVPIR